MISSRIFNIALIGLALFAFSVVGCATPQYSGGLPPRIDSVEAAAGAAPQSVGLFRNSGRLKSSGSC